jgi:hypothetical protein
MKKLTLIVAIVLFVCTTQSVSAVKLSNGDVKVKEYTSKKGKVVKEYIRKAPNKTTADNYSKKGNTNPYTNKKGTSKK